jgi:hypothetical protein
MPGSSLAKRANPGGGSRDNGIPPHRAAKARNRLQILPSARSRRRLRLMSCAGPAVVCARLPRRRCYATDTWDPNGGRRADLRHCRVWLQSIAHRPFTISDGGFAHIERRQLTARHPAGEPLNRGPREPRLGLSAGTVRAHSDDVQPSESAPSADAHRATAPARPARLNHVTRVRYRHIYWYEPVDPIRSVPRSAVQLDERPLHVHRSDWLLRVSTSVAGELTCDDATS